MSAGKKRQTMAKQARERAVREKRALKLERKREAAHLRLVGEAESLDVPAEPGDAPEQGLRLVVDSLPSVATAEPEAGSGERDEGDFDGAHA